MDFGISNKVAVVTGAGKGIGRAIAEALAAEGALVVVTDIDEDGVYETVASIRDAGGRAEGRQLDVTIKADVERLFGQTADELGPIEILVNNAGIVRRHPTATITDEEWDLVERVNVRGALYCCQAVMEHMKARGWGRIVNVVSLAIKAIGSTDVASYAASKAALGGLTKILAKELAPFGVTVNAVLPGSIALTDFNTSMSYPKSIDLMPGMTIPVGRRGTPDDVAPVVAFLCATQARYVTGEFVDVNGGSWMD